MTIFESVRQLLSHGDTSQALRLLITHFESQKTDPDTLRYIRLLENGFITARQKENSGILDFQEAQKVYSRTASELLIITDDLAAGRKPVFGKENSAQAKPLIYWLIGGGILLLLGLAAGILIRENPARETFPPLKPANQECPPFDSASIQVMLIPFLNQGEGNSRPELAIQALIRDLTTRNNVKADVQLYNGDRFQKSPPDTEDAAETGRNCRAKMVIWGLYEKVEGGISIDVRYVFTEKPNLPAGAIADTFRNLTELRADSARFGSLEDAVFSLCTFMALHEGNTDLAKKWLNKVKTPSERQQKIKEML